MKLQREIFGTRLLPTLPSQFLSTLSLAICFLLVVTVGSNSQSCHAGVLKCNEPVHSALSLTSVSQHSFSLDLLAQGDSTPKGDSEKGSEESGPTWWEVVFSGGPLGTVIILGLVALSMCSVFLVIDQIIALRKKELMPDGLAIEVRDCLLQGKVDQAVAYCQEKPSTLSFVLLHGIEEIPFGWSSVEKATEDALAEQSARLYRKTEYLSVIGNIAPMVGLLGTVLGMILAFHRVAQSQGTAAAPELAEGIYQALITTVGGLLVAIPSLGAFAIFRNRLDQLIAESAHASQNVFSSLRTKRKSKSSSSERSKSSNDSSK